MTVVKRKIPEHLLNATRLSKPKKYFFEECTEVEHSFDVDNTTLSAAKAAINKFVNDKKNPKNKTMRFVVEDLGNKKVRIYRSM
jgi:hypothetical protein